MMRVLSLAVGLLFSVQTLDDQVYYGTLDGAKNPAEVVASTVFAEIPEYREIQDQGLDEDDPEYWSLLEKANDKFYAAVKKVAGKKKYDVVVEKGSAESVKNAPDITREVIQALPK